MKGNGRTKPSLSVKGPDGGGKRGLGGTMQTEKKRIEGVKKITELGRTRKDCSRWIERRRKRGHNFYQILWKVEY